MLDAETKTRLDSVCDGYLLHARGAEWQTYLNGLIETHTRKYKLVPMLRGIR